MGHRERLLAAARDLVLERGPGGVTARDLVAASGTNLASIGYHFGAKDALVQEAVNGLLDDWNQRVRRLSLADPDLDPLARMVAAWRVLFDDFETNRALFTAELEATAHALRSEPVRRRLADHYEDARGVFAETVSAALGEEGERHGVDARLVSSFLLAVADGLILQHLVDPERAPSADQLGEALRAALTAALAARPTGSPAD